MKGRILQTENNKTTILIRLMVGAVFLSEGIQKFLFPDKIGAGCCTTAEQIGRCFWDLSFC